MFYNCLSLASLPDISKWNVDNVGDNEDIFNNCLSLLPDNNIFTNLQLNHYIFIFNNKKSDYSLDNFEDLEISDNELSEQDDFNELNSNSDSNNL